MVMEFITKEKEIKEEIERCGGKYIDQGMVNSFYVSFNHLQDWIRFSSKNPWEESEEIQVTCYQQKLKEKDFVFIMEFIKFLKSLGFGGKND